MGPSSGSLPSVSAFSVHCLNVKGLLIFVILTDASEGEEKDAESPSSGYTETRVTESAEYIAAPGTGTDAQADSNSFRAIDLSQPVSAADNSIKIAESESMGPLPLSAWVTINQEKVYQSGQMDQSLMSDSEPI